MVVAIGFKIIEFVFSKKILEKNKIKAVYPRGIKKKRMTPHQKKELTSQICETSITKDSLKKAMHSDTIENRIIGNVNKTLFFVELRGMSLMQVVYNKHIPTIGLKKIEVKILHNIRKILNLLFLGSNQITKNKRTSPLITPCNAGVAK